MAVHVTGADANLRKEALLQLASVDLLGLCHEAKVEHCRATRDLRSCGRDVQHVLSSCGHASLCEECSQRCDVCPVCRAAVLKSGTRLHIRLFNKCVEAGLISRKYDERYKEKIYSREHLDIQRLYALFDVALENNLVSLICHYVTDVCLDERAVSSDPILAFLLDEVVIKNWCKWKYKSFAADLHDIYMLDIEGMGTKLDMLSKLSSRLSGISYVLEVLETSFSGTHSVELRDLHLLSENILKIKQHLEVMIWCIRQKFLQNVKSLYPDSISWKLHVNERKSAADERAWPSFTSKTVESDWQHGPTLFVEDALSNLHLEQDLGEELADEFDLTLLKADKYQLPDPQMVGVSGLYPFKNLRSAADILFLHGRSDMVIAKQAIFLYYILDRHWSKTDDNWRRIVEDYAASFGITRHSLLESLVFYLLDDHSEQALLQAAKLLPEIAGPYTHPRVAKVLLERQSPELALMVLRCAGRDRLSTHPITKHVNACVVPLSESVLAVQVRIECGLLTEAFMYQRMHCSQVKEDKSKYGSSSLVMNDSKGGFDPWMHHTEVLVTEICQLCMRRNLVDRMIELPWNHDEEIFLHKCLLNNASQFPSSINGSLLVVFYLQRCRYIEACQVDYMLQSFERNFFQAASEEEISRLRNVSQWRATLISKCIDLIPEVQRLQIETRESIGNGVWAPSGTKMGPIDGFTDENPSNSSSLASSMKPSHPRTNNVSFAKQASVNVNMGLTRSNGFFAGGLMSDDTTPQQIDVSMNRSMASNNVEKSCFSSQDKKILPGMELSKSANNLERSRFSFLLKESVQGRSPLGMSGRNGAPKSPHHNPVSTSSARDTSEGQSLTSIQFEEAKLEFSLRSDKREVSKNLNVLSGPRWRSDESSGDEAKPKTSVGRISSVKWSR